MLALEETFVKMTVIYTHFYKVSRSIHAKISFSNRLLIGCLFLQVQRSLNDRVQNFAECDNSPSAPHEIDGDGDGLNETHLYPSLHNLPTMPR